jgi:hypothetical protein
VEPRDDGRDAHVTGHGDAPASAPIHRHSERRQRFRYLPEPLSEGVDRTYQFLHGIFDEHTGRELLGWLAEHDPVPAWNTPHL